MDDILRQWLWLAFIPLVGFLLLRQRQRALRLAAERTARQRAISQGVKTIDVAPLREGLQSLKANYASASRARATDAPAKRSLVTCAREKMSRLGFFRHQPTPAESELGTH